MVRSSLVVVVVSAAVTTARADQCQLVDADAAAWAVKLVKNGMVVSYCAKCGDKAPKKPEKVARAEVKPDGSDSEVQINGQGVDLAYTYVQTGKTTWSNVAALVGCPTTGVQSFVTLAAKPVAYAVPSSCDDWKKATADLLSTCKKLGATDRKRFQDSLDTAEKGWSKPGIEQTKLASACTTAATAVRRAATVCARPDAPALGANCKINTDCTPNFCCTSKDGTGDRVCVRSTTEGMQGTCNK